MSTEHKQEHKLPVGEKVYSSTRVGPEPRLSRLAHTLPSSAVSTQQMAALPAVTDQSAFPNPYHNGVPEGCVSHTSTNFEFTEVQPTNLAGLEHVNVNNIDTVELSSVLTHERVGHKSSTRKRQHDATNAATWQSASFNGPSAKLKKFDSTMHHVTAPSAATGPALQEAASSSHRYGKPATSITSHSQPELKPVSEIIIRSVQPPTQHSRPRFVPRQLSSVMAAEAAAAHKKVVANSVVLGDEQGVRLPREVEKDIRATNEQHVVDDTTLSIRQKIKEVGFPTYS